MSVTPVTIGQDRQIELDFLASLVDTDDSETLEFAATMIPEGVEVIPLDLSDSNGTISSLVAIAPSTLAEDVGFMVEFTATATELSNGDMEKTILNVIVGTQELFTGDEIVVRQSVEDLSVINILDSNGEFLRDLDLSLLGDTIYGVGDINGDGNANIITGFAVNGTQRLEILDSNGTKIDSLDLSLLGDTIYAIGDLNGDNSADILTGFAVNGTQRLEVLDSNGTKIDSLDLSLLGDTIYAVGDVNGDGNAILTGFAADGTQVIQVTDSNEVKIDTLNLSAFGFDISGVGNFISQSGNDTITGTNNADVVISSSGDDQIIGGSGADILVLSLDEDIGDNIFLDFEPFIDAFFILGVSNANDVTVTDDGEFGATITFGPDAGSGPGGSIEIPTLVGTFNSILDLENAGVTIEGL